MSDSDHGNEQAAQRKYVIPRIFVDPSYFSTQWEIDQKQEELEPHWEDPLSKAK
jgi:hypothetical protein